MRHIWASAALILAVAAGWGLVQIVCGEEAGPTTVTTPSGPSATPPATPAPVAKVKSETPAAPGATAPVAPPKTATITPPAPLPDVEIPPIPEIDKDPFKPGPPPVRKKRTDALEEGKHLFNREGRLELDPIGRPVYVFETGDKPMRLLENSWRQYMEKMTDNGRKKAHWRVSGTVTLYDGENFLLVTRAMHVTPEEEGL
jgi:hypothetical protein